MKIDPQVSHPKEKEMLAVGEAMFFYRAGISDFSCATCHAEPGKRIRLQGLPDLSKPGKQAQETMGSWPTYRVSQSQLRTMQHRLWDCFRQARFPAAGLRSPTATPPDALSRQCSQGRRDHRPIDQALSRRQHPCTD